MNFINQIFGSVLKFFNDISGNYLFAILLFALFTKILLFPLSIKQQKSQRRQAEIYPKEKAIRKKYEGQTDVESRNALNRELTDLYQREKYSPMGGCLPLLIQLPLLIFLYNVIRSPLKYICGYSSASVKAIKEALVACKDSLVDLSTKAADMIANGAEALDELAITAIIENDANFNTVASYLSGLENPVEIVNNIPNFTVFGINLSGQPAMGEWNLLLLIPVLTFIMQFVAMKLNRKLSYMPANATPEMKMSNNIMDVVMPLMMTWMTFMFPATLGIYWMFTTILGVVQQYILKKMYPAPVFTEDDFKAAEKEVLTGKAPKNQLKDRTVPGKTYRSLHHIDDEDEDAPAFAPLSEEDRKPEAPVLKEEKSKNKKK